MVAVSLAIAVGVSSLFQVLFFLVVARMLQGQEGWVLGQAG